jgi:hypothetical protein
VVSICAAAECTQGAVAVLLSIRPTATALTSAPNPSVVGQRVTFTAAVASQAKGTPTGTVKFLDETTNNTNLGSVSLNGSGIAALTLSSFASFNDLITAVYSGDKNFALSTSPYVQQFVQDFDLVANAPTSQTVTPGQAANYSGTLSPVGFTQTISLTCSGAPANSTCSVMPGSATLDGGPSVTVNVALVTKVTGMGLTEPMNGSLGRGVPGPHGRACWHCCCSVVTTASVGSGVRSGVTCGLCLACSQLGSACRHAEEGALAMAAVGAAVERQTVRTL